MNKIENYIIYRGMSKPRKVKDRIVAKMGINFRGLVTILVDKQASYVDYTTTTHRYLLDNTVWTKINLDTQLRLITENGLTYEHIDLEGY